MSFLEIVKCSVITLAVKYCLTSVRVDIRDNVETVVCESYDRIQVQNSILGEQTRESAAEV